MTQHEHHDKFLATGKRFCYQCEKPVNYLFADGRGSCCTRLTKEEIEGNVDEPCGYCGDSQDPNDICFTCFSNLKNEEDNTWWHQQDEDVDYHASMECNDVPSTDEYNF